MATKTWRDASPPQMPYPDDGWRAALVDVDYLAAAVRPKQFIAIDQSDCILCEGCVDICPWRCIHLVSLDAIADVDGLEQPGADPADQSVFVIDDDLCTRCALCVDRCPTGVITLGTLHTDPPEDRRIRTDRYGYAYGVRY